MLSGGEVIVSVVYARINVRVAIWVIYFIAMISSWICRCLQYLCNLQTYIYTNIQLNVFENKSVCS